jgi:hypothetical protein
MKVFYLTQVFFLRFLNDNDPLFKNADNYFRYFIERDITMIVSTISIAEYCVGGDSSETTTSESSNTPVQFKSCPKGRAVCQVYL